MQEERDLWMASRRYIIDEIDIDELKEAERSFNDAFDRAMAVLARRNIAQKRKLLIKQIFSAILNI